MNIDMETKFTSGKWVLFEREEWIDILSDSGRITSIDKSNENDPSAMFDAKLIAAAPDLFEALLLFTREIENSTNNTENFEEAYHYAQIAIKKATE